MHISAEGREVKDQEVLSLQQKHAIHKVLDPSGHEPSKPLIHCPQKGGGHQFVEY